MLRQSEVLAKPSSPRPSKPHPSPGSSKTASVAARAPARIASPKQFPVLLKQQQPHIGRMEELPSTVLPRTTVRSCHIMIFQVAMDGGGQLRRLSLSHQSARTPSFTASVNPGTREATTGTPIEAASSPDSPRSLAMRGRHKNRHRRVRGTWIALKSQQSHPRIRAELSAQRRINRVCAFPRSHEHQVGLGVALF